MTFCVGIRVEEGLVALADTRITSGSECITARKMTAYNGKTYFFFVTTSGLRSTRDKVLTYFDEIFEKGKAKKQFDKLYKVANLFSELMRKVHREDAEYLKESGISFNSHLLLGGQMENDKEHNIFFIYPQGNWVMVGKGTPYQIIGATHYGKPVLDRTLKFTDSLTFALKVGTLAFDSTRISAADVDFPLDVVIYQKNSYKHFEHRYEKNDLAAVSSWWQSRLRESVDNYPSDWIESVFRELPKGNARKHPIPKHK